MRIPFRKQIAKTQNNFRSSLGQQYPDVEARTLDIVQAVQPFTMTSPERLIALCDAIKHVVLQKIPGDIVECGVWRGGSMMAAAMALLDHNCTSRTLWLYDTFSGMSPPTPSDVDHQGKAAAQMLSEQDRNDASSIWCYSPLQEVKSNLQKTGYPSSQIRCIVGQVEQSLPDCCPDQISLLRLDTDWYESTRHELIHLFPRLAPGGVLIIDDYGHWAGCRQAVDEYFEQTGIPILLTRIDYTGRVGVKPVDPSLDSSLHPVRKAG